MLLEPEQVFQQVILPPPRLHADRRLGRDRPSVVRLHPPPTCSVARRHDQRARLEVRRHAPDFRDRNANVGGASSRRAGVRDGHLDVLDPLRSGSRTCE
jgi:hypothetical protein